MTQEEKKDSSHVLGLTELESGETIILGEADRETGERVQTFINECLEKIHELQFQLKKSAVLVTEGRDLLNLVEAARAKLKDELHEMRKELDVTRELWDADCMRLEDQVTALQDRLKEKEKGEKYGPTQ